MYENWLIFRFYFGCKKFGKCCKFFYKVFENGDIFRSKILGDYLGDFNMVKRIIK